ncbi:hypothetical protein Tco_0778857, partial [Tanacetum coccineum]
IEPKKISEALDDESRIEAMHEELLQFKIQKVWVLVDFPYGKKTIGTKWVYRNKKDERALQEFCRLATEITHKCCFVAIYTPVTHTLPTIVESRFGTNLPLDFPHTFPQNYPHSYILCVVRG